MLNAKTREPAVSDLHGYQASPILADCAIRVNVRLRRKRRRFEQVDQKQLRDELPDRAVEPRQRQVHLASGPHPSPIERPLGGRRTHARRRTIEFGNARVLLETLNQALRRPTCHRALA